MRTPRLIPVPLATGLTLVAIANPAAASDNARVPTWPTHPKPITEYATQPPGPPQWPTDPQPLTSYRTSVQTSDGDFDWGSAGIGAAVVVGAFLIALGGAAGFRRRRQMQPAATG